MDGSEVEVIFMTRELRSFAHVLTHTSHPENVYLVPDLALSLKKLGGARRIYRLHTPHPTPQPKRSAPQLDTISSPLSPPTTAGQAQSVK